MIVTAHLYIVVTLHIFTFSSTPKMRHTISSSENVQKDVTNAQLRGIQSTEVFTAFKDPLMKSFIEKYEFANQICNAK